jgi:hypothetical protein
MDEQEEINQMQNYARDWDLERLMLRSMRDMCGDFISSATRGPRSLH